MVAPDTQAVLVHNSEIRLSGGQTLVGRHSKPAYRSRTILRDAVAFIEHHPEIVLSISVALVGERTPESDCSRIVAPLCGVQSIFEWP
jgi:hypothetical protein